MTGLADDASPGTGLAARDRNEPPALPTAPARGNSADRPAPLWTDTLTALADPSLDPLFWRAEQLGAASAWWQHVPFAHWIVCATAPRTLVELGTHTGVSYTAFCQAVMRAGLATRSFAVDTWQGDPHAGFYGPEVLDELRRYHDERFGAFSTLLQHTFDEAVDYFEDRSVDLLHIDGLHTYEAVRHDFETWLPKLSERAVVLFHDTNVRGGEFGVWRLWAELGARYPAFEFVHGHGLGVLAVGAQMPAPVAALCELADPAAVAVVRTRFARLGERWWIDTRERLSAADSARSIATARTEAEQLRAEEARRRAAAEQRAGDLERRLALETRLRTRAEQKLAEAETHRRDAAAESLLATQRFASAKQRSARKDAELALLQARVAELDTECAGLQRERDEVLGSTFWRATGPARRLASILPPRLKRQGRRGARAVYWLLTPHRTAERIAYFRSLRRNASLILATDAHPNAVANRPDAEPPVWAEFFDAEWYVERYADIKAAGVAPLDHFIRHGAAAGRDPNPAFDTAWYIDANRDVAKSETLAIEHFVLWGAEEGRVPFKGFDFYHYRQQAGIAHATNLEAYRHYLKHGRAAGLCPSPVYPLTDGLQPRPHIVPTYDELFARRFAALEPLRTYEAPHPGARVTIVTDSINAGSLYGGVATAIILATLLATRLGAALRLVTRTEPPVADNIAMILRTHDVAWNGNIECLYSPSGSEGRDVPMSRDDLFLTTSWWTTHATRKSVPPSQIVYMLGEDERMFYPTGDEHLLCAETLMDPKVFYAVNSSILFDHLQSRGMAPGGIAFEPAFPSTAYYPEKRPEADERRQFFFYARPNNLRNLYWRGISAIAGALEGGVFDTEKWDFCFLGKDADEVVLPRGVRPRIMNDAPREEYVKLVRRVDVGLSLIYTPHPSYPPFDLAASGAVVVTNRFGESKVDLSRYSPNILCVEPSLRGLVEGLGKAVALAEDRATRTANAAMFGMPRDWATALTPILDHLAGQHRTGLRPKG